MKAFILGCGRVGAMLAGLLDKDKTEVTVIDANENAFEKLGDNFSGNRVTGNITDEGILQNAGIDQADLVAVLTSDDIANLMSAQIVKQKFGRERILVRVRDPVKAAVFREMGLATVCPTNVEFEIIMKELGIKPKKGKGQ